MDFQDSSPHIITPPFQQPTYTTAGTVYNPSTSQPLQAPTRRGRHSKYTNGHGQAPLALLPKSELAALPFRVLIDRYQAQHQYSPLQQNYDRAVSPGNSTDPEKNPLAMLSGGGRLVHSRSPVDEIPAYSFGRDTATNNHTIDTTGSDIGSECDFSTDPLLGMTVKSLQNLASYPNPNQKRAQKALLRGTRPNLSGISRENSMEQQHSSVGGPSVPRQGPPGHTELVPSYTRSLTRDNNSSMLPRRPPPGLMTRDEIAGSYLHYGGGVPIPLTAGPPGQRQYRPSTFESTFKALGTNSGLQTASRQHGTSDESGNHNSTLVNGKARFSSLLNDAPMDPGPVGQRHASDYKGIIAPEGQGEGLGRAISPTNSLLSGLRQGRGMAVEEMGQKPPSWRDDHPQPGFRCEPGTSRLSDEAKEVRAKETSRIWYAGAGLLNIVMFDSVENDNAGGDMPLTWTTTPYVPLSIEEANQSSTADYMKPLLNAALATFERCAKEDWFKEILASYD